MKVRIFQIKFLFVDVASDLENDSTVMDTQYDDSNSGEP